jgi:hydrogenase maturation protease
MRAFRRVFATIGLFVSLAGFIVFTSAAVVVWWVRAETNRRTDDLVVKAHGAISAADTTVTFVHQVIDQGQADLKEARKQKPAAPQEPVNPFLQLTARKASESLAGSVERANTAVRAASDAAVVAEAAVHVFSDDSQMSELKNWLGIKPEQLHQTRNQLNRASSELNQVKTVLGVPLGEGPTEEQLQMVETAFGQARELTNQMGKVVSTARTRVDETKRTIDLWALRVALIITVAGVVGAVGQFFMARFCVRVLRGLPA